jgi:hypothetical protein
MKESVWLVRLLCIGAVLESLAGLGLLAFPSLLVSLLFGEPLTDTGLVVARLAGGGLLGLGVACWYARVTPVTHAGIGVAIGFLIYNVVASVALATAQPAAATGVVLLGAAALHGLLAIGLVAALFARR